MISETLFYKACEVVISAGKASTALLQRRLQISYEEASILMTELESRKIIKRNHDKPSELLISDINECEW